MGSKELKGAEMPGGLSEGEPSSITAAGMHGLQGTKSARDLFLLDFCEQGGLGQEGWMRCFHGPALCSSPKFRTQTLDTCFTYTPVYPRAEKPTT